LLIWRDPKRAGDGAGTAALTTSPLPTWVEEFDLSEQVVTGRGAIEISTNIRPPASSSPATTPTRTRWCRSLPMRRPGDAPPQSQVRTASSLEGDGFEPSVPLVSRGDLPAPVHRHSFRPLRCL